MAAGGAYRRLARGGASNAVRTAFHIDGGVALPDRFHCLITLPAGDSDFSNRIKAIKIRFVRQLAACEFRNAARAKKGERDVWQRRFWEHLIRDAADFARHLDDIHRNPLKHGLVADVAGMYPVAWRGQAESLPQAMACRSSS